MRRIKTHKSSKRALTLVELVVALALTAIFAGACVMLIYPISRIYTHVNEISRAQILADSVVDSLRSECARTTITGSGDVWIASSGDSVMTAHENLPSGDVLVIRRSNEYCETIFADSSIPASACSEIRTADLEYLNSGNATSRAVYRLFDMSGSSPVALASDTDAGYLHYGYYNAVSDSDGYVCPATYYDFTNPLPTSAYKNYTVALDFSEIVCSGTYPAFVTCKVSILLTRGDVATEIYSRTVVLCFASPVVQ